MSEPITVRVLRAAGGAALLYDVVGGRGRVREYRRLGIKTVVGVDLDAEPGAPLIDIPVGLCKLGGGPAEGSPAGGGSASGPVTAWVARDGADPCALSVFC